MSVSPVPHCQTQNLDCRWWKWLPHYLLLDYLQNLMHWLHPHHQLHVRRQLLRQVLPQLLAQQQALMRQLRHQPHWILLLQLLNLPQ